MAPSKEAMAAAEKLVSAIQDDDDVGIWGLYICGIHAESYITEPSARKDERDVRAQIATALDDHTADLRAEVEALRAERDKNADTVTVWGWVWNEGGGMYPDSVELWDDEEYIAFDGKDWLHKAAEWVRAKESEATKELS